MSRRPGPAPKDPADRARRNADPLLAGGSDWTELPDTPYAGQVPEIPEWVDVGAVGHAFYARLAELPQAAAWSPGDWLSLQLALPLVERYLARPTAEVFKAVTAGLGAGLGLTSADLARLRRRIVPADPVAEDSADPAEPTSRRPPLRLVDPALLPDESG
ncbi:MULTISPECIES: hypothetical protein [unclassified Crossiella]|uniref:phage terminase small subunit n=1 Tax=unclassified Crossiella TaxID=2620835 RepID=UPI001FFFAA0D|nr:MULTISPECIES: hypothetical protein [unclassified Crossiella]MCK2242331.1 hypothetical protein [Crossiella sp. S99.2]MCK2254638.1 hypothetical protein [Crossiella sp. S99.1]